ncbi:MAG: hypothetical protein RR651_03795, partial [Lysinibacillus sp.]
MRISSFIQQDRLASIENNKRVIQRKEAGNAYKKNAQYFQPKKNPVLEELEKLLLGHKDLELYEKDKESQVEMNEVTAAIHELQQTEQNVRTHKTTNEDELVSTAQKTEQSFFVEKTVKNTVPESLDEQTIQILESVKSAALAPTDPSSQDLRIAASADAQIQIVKGKLDGNEDLSFEVDEEPAFVRETIEVNVPERFAKELKLDPIAETIFGKSFEEAYKARTYHYAKSVYVMQTEMAKGGFRYVDEAKYSLT